MELGVKPYCKLAFDLEEVGDGEVVARMRLSSHKRFGGLLAIAPINSRTAELVGAGLGLDLREIGYFEGCSANSIEQLETICAQCGIVRIDCDLLEECVHRWSQG